MPFANLGLSPTLCLPLIRLGYVQPTPIQTEAIPVVLLGRDLLARAQTGTGKTAAFGLPMIDRLLGRTGRPPAAANRPRGLVLVPTRELALQVHEDLSVYGAPLKLRSAAIFGGVSMGPQVQTLRRGVDLVVATPGRLLDHLQRRTIDLSAIEILTLDEADRMLDMGFLPPLRRVLGALPKDRQTLLCSATFSNEVVSLSAEFTREPVRVDVSAQNAVASTVTHRVHAVAQDRKRELLIHLLTRQPGCQTLVFCRTKHGSNRVGRHLEHVGVRAAVIHGNKSQSARTRALADFKSGRVMVLVATDVAARGLDIEQLPRVVNFDLPLVAEDYVHRVGRTGRAGLPGQAVSLVSEGETALLRDIQRLLPSPVEQVAVAGFETMRLEPRDASPRPGRSRPGGPAKARTASAWGLRNGPGGTGRSSGTTTRPETRNASMRPSPTKSRGTPRRSSDADYFARL